jgi:hypothetical protein
MNERRQGRRKRAWENEIFGWIGTGFMAALATMVALSVLAMWAHPLWGLVEWTWTR